MTLSNAAVDKITKQLQSAGIKVRVDLPDEELDFLIRIDTNAEHGVIDLEPGKVDLMVFPDKAHRQAVLWADEEKRTVTRNVVVYANKNNKADAVKQLVSGSHFGIHLPEGTTYKIDEGPTFDTTTTSAWTAKVTATVPASRQTFLIGRDEHSHFVSLLPKRVRSVADAHKALRPRGVPADAPRQGEWFFVPATAAEKSRIEKHVADTPQNIKPSWLGAAEHGRERDYIPRDTYHDWQDDTSHAALMSVFLARPVRKGQKSIPPKAMYVVGYIFDDRSPQDMPSRHDPLWLSDWHRVVRNLEVVMDGDDSESWD